MRRTILAVCVMAVVPLPAMRAQSAAPAPAAARAAAKLPVRRVILYKNGIGYFEHVGKVRGSETVTVDFNSSQLNDVLKTLTALDLGNGRVTGVSYNSEAPLTQRLGGLRLPVGEHATLAELLDALRGARLEVHSGERVVTGRLLGVEQRTSGRGDEKTTRDELTLVSDAGDIRTVEITPAVTVRLAERDSSEQVGAYLGLLASTRAQDRRRMSIATAGTGDRDLLVSYISEVPVWKTTYRIVLPTQPGGRPMLQGWAIVDNTIGEDWQNVELSLVAGAPQSFIQQLSQPLYVQRPVVPLPKALLIAPQTHEGTLNEEEKVAADAMAPAAAPSRSNRVDAREGPAGGIVGGLAPAPMNRRAVADMAVQIAPAAEGRELGDLFEYRVKEPISIARNQSALVPILRADVAVDRVSLWNERSGARPLRALWMTNSSGLTLDAGSFTVLDAGAFAGEGLSDALKPNEKRLLSYAIDLGVQVEARNGDERRTVTRLSIAHGVLVQHSEHVARRVYAIRNSDTTERRIVIEHPVRAGWKLTGGTTPAETSADAYRFVVQVPAAKTETLTVTEQQPLDSTYRVADITDQQVELFVRESGNDQALKSALAPIVAAKAALAAVGAELNARAAELKRIGDDQERVRENMKALKGSSEEQQLVRRYATQLAQQEDRVEVLKRESENLERRRNDGQADLIRLIEALSVDVQARTTP